MYSCVCTALHTSHHSSKGNTQSTVLQGFVSNKDSDEEGKGDPIETLLYAVFVASSERASVAELASILSVEVSKLQMAISIACRLGFGTRLMPTTSGKHLPLWHSSHVCSGWHGNTCLSDVEHQNHGL